MKNETKQDPALPQLQVLAEFRHELRNFLHFSELAAAQFDLQPQQHQLLLQIAGAPAGTVPTIGYVAERLGLRHHTTVELSKRCEEAGLIARRHQGEDRRCVLLRLTRAGDRLLKALSVAHARELNVLAPRLICALKRIQASAEQQPKTRIRSGK